MAGPVITDFWPRVFFYSAVGGMIIGFIAMGGIVCGIGYGLLQLLHSTS